MTDALYARPARAATQGGRPAPRSCLPLRSRRDLFIAHHDVKRPPLGTPLTHEAVIEFSRAGVMLVWNTWGVFIFLPSIRTGTPRRERVALPCVSHAAQCQCPPGSAGAVLTVPTSRPNFCQVEFIKNNPSCRALTSPSGKAGPRLKSAGDRRLQSRTPGLGAAELSVHLLRPQGDSAFAVLVEGSQDPEKDDPRPFSPRNRIGAYMRAMARFGSWRAKRIRKSSSCHGLLKNGHTCPGSVEGVSPWSRV